MCIRDLDHSYSFEDLASSVPDGFEITEHQDYTERARQRIFSDSVTANYDENSPLTSKNEFPAEETVWIADFPVTMHYLAEENLDNEYDFIVKNNEKQPNQSEGNAEAEAVSRLANLVHKDLGIAYPETINLPYEENSRERSEAMRFIPNIADAEDFSDLSSDSDWLETTRDSLHDLYVFNYWVGGDGDNAMNFGYSPSGDIVAFDYHPDVGSNISEQQSRRTPLGVGDMFIDHPNGYEPKGSQLVDWEIEIFEEAVRQIEEINNGKIEDALSDLESDRVNVEGVKQRRNKLGEIFSREVLWD